MRAQQATLLADIVARNRDTAFGRRHGFGRIHGAADYQRRVPLHKWPQVEPWVERLCAGEQNVLTADPVVLFHQTNGTTGRNKLIPVTPRCERVQASGYRRWVDGALRDNPAMLARGVVGIVSWEFAGRVPCGIPFGYVSGNVFTRRMPARVRRQYAYPYAALTIPDPDARRYTLMRLALARDCSFVFTGNPGALLLLFELADSASEAIIRDVHDGTLACADRVPPELLAALRPLLRPRPARARVLGKMRARGGRLRPADYWPGLALVACWLGGTVGRFSSQFPPWLGDGVPLRDVGYMSSEGTFSIPMQNGEPSGALALPAAFYEFIPVREYGRDGAPVLLAHEVEEGGEYQVILTTSGGLYRYAINDIVRVTGRYRGVPLIRFLHKGENVKNIAGEMLNADQVQSAMAAAAARIGLAFRHLQVEANLARNRYVFCVEPLGTAPCDAAALADVLEQELGRASQMYREFREESALESCQVRFMRAGWYDALLADAAARGLRESQYKAPLMVDAVEREDMAE